MSSPAPRIARVLVLLVASGVSLVCAQVVESPADDEAAAETRDRAGAAKAAAAELTARSQAVHQQLAAIGDGAERFRLLDDLATQYRRAGRMGEYLKTGDEIVEDSRISAGRRSLRASTLALNTALIGDYPKSQRLVARARTLARETQPAELENLVSEPSYAFLQAEAEIARRSTNRSDVALLKTREIANLAWTNFNDPALSDKRHRAAANELLSNVNLHVRLLVQNNRRQEALSYVNEIRQRMATQKGLTPSNNQMASIGEAIAIALSSQDDYDAALKAIDASLALSARNNTPEFELGVGSARRMRLMIALAMGRIESYKEDADALMRGRAANPVLQGSFPSAEAESLFMATRGQWSDAAVRVGEEMARNARRGGTEGPGYKYQAAMQLLYRLNDPAHPVAESEIATFVGALANDDPDWADANYRGAYVEDGALASALNVLVPAGKAPTDSGAALAFKISELLRSSASQGALADGAARLAANDPKLRALIEQEQGLRFDQNSSRRSFSVASDRALAAQKSNDEAVAKRMAGDAADKERALQATNAKLRQLRRDIAAQFPIYRELVSPSIPTAAKVGAALHPGEVYVNFYSGVSSGYAFVIQPGGRLTATRLSVTRAQTRQWIASLRAPFDAGQLPERAGDAGGFDLAASYALFKAWLAPLQTQLQESTTIYVSAGGVLGTVPWDVLVTEPGRDLASAKWWLDRVTPVAMPSASSLVLLRGQPTKRGERPFQAFADPSFDGSEAPTVGVAASTRSVRQVVGSAGDGTGSVDYRKLPRLPETFDEVEAIRTSLNGDERGIVRGVQASRSRVMKESLSDVRVLAFATHGLLPGEVPGLLQPGLAMAYEGTGLANSLLTIDDIVALRLNADWVILSACNTGYATGGAGDSMSALSRGFFAAGARTVLATQWAVESQSAKQLTVGTFKALAADPSLSKGEALARTQRDMKAGKYGALYRHPYFWAPYFLAGDAAR